VRPLLLQEAVALAAELGGAAAPRAADERPLTGRERQVLALVAAGQRTKAIGTVLRLSPRTVERHLSNLYAKLDLRGRAEASAHALREETPPAR
jgi:DNA-binding CsgD family transcriptional regulator